MSLRRRRGGHGGCLDLLALLVVLVLLSLSSISAGSFGGRGVRIDLSSGGYEDVAVVISQDLKKAECPQILENVKVAMTEASRSLYSVLDWKLHFASINIQVPKGWTAADCQTPLEPNKPFREQDGDIFVSVDHPIHNSTPWTQQSQGCNSSGDFIYLPRSFIHSTKDKPVAGGNSSSKNQTYDDNSGSNLFSNLGDEIRNQWLRYRFGVFSDLERTPAVSSLQHTLCHGRTAEEIVHGHPDWTNSMVSNKSYSSSSTIPGKQPSRSSPLPPPPRFTISNAQSPKYVIVLENSLAMNNKDHWELIRRATMKFIVHDLPADARLGIVLFNDGAHIAYPVELLHSAQIREGLTVQIKNKFSLNPKNDSCVRCGVMKAIEALQQSLPASSSSSSATLGGTVVVISQGKSTSLALNEEEELLQLAAKHRVQVFSVAIPLQPQDDISLSLERLAHSTGGLSFFIPEEFYGKEESELSTYVSLVDAFREIQARTTGDGPYLIHEKTFQAHSSSRGPLEESGSFVIDKYVGRATNFNVFAINRENGFLKSISVVDTRSQQFKGIQDGMAAFHILSVYNVPFEGDSNIGMNWTYTLERMPSSHSDNKHIVRVTSRARKIGEDIKIRFFTNIETHAVKVRPDNPIKLFAEVKLNGVPVIDARVVAHIQAINQSGFLMPSIEVLLVDNGNGDPDLRGRDGVYSRYLTNFSGGEGRYTVSLAVDDNQGRAFSYQGIDEDSFSGRSCCKDEASRRPSIRSQKLGTFHRITHGDSFRIPTIIKSGSSFPPCRILDLHVEVQTSTQQLEFTWTAPGEDFDQGKATSYQLFSSDYPTLFYSNLNATKPVDGFSATKSAGEKETHRVHVGDFNRNIYYAMVAVDKEGNVGEVSNIKQAYMPSPSSIASSAAAAAAAGGGDYSNGSPDHVVNTGRHEKALLYIIVGIVAFVVLCIVLVLIIVISYRRKKLSSSQTDLSETMRSMGVCTGGAMGNGGGGGSNRGSNESGLACGADAHSPGFAVCDEQDLVKEQETNGFLSGYGDLTPGQHHTGSTTQNSVSFADENPYSNNTLNSSTYGWTDLNNPYVTKCIGSALPTYQDFQSQQQQQQVPNGFVPNYLAFNQPMYARPVPKSQRNNNSNIYANTTQPLPQQQVGFLNMQHSTPQSPSGSSSQSSSTHNIASSLAYRQNLTNSFLAQQQQQQTTPHLPPGGLTVVSGGGGGGSLTGSGGDDRVPSISPPIEGAAAENIRLISSLSNTPTKSILKKPKDHQLSLLNNSSSQPPQTSSSSSSSGGGGGGRLLYPGQQQQQPPQQQEDQSSQSSSGGGKEERFSESSNMSFSDRDSPLLAVEPQLEMKEVAAAEESKAHPDYSPSNTYLETSFEDHEGGGGGAAARGVPPPTMPKPRLAGMEADGDATEASTLHNNTTLDKKIRNITQV